MGGFGSGRKFGADCTEDCLSIDVRRWQREGRLVPGQYFTSYWTRNGRQLGLINVKAEAGQLRLIYSCRRNGEEWESLDYPVRLQTTACHYGGIRYWFTCPASGCGRRVAILYLGDKIFACRHCYQLAYRSQREVPDDRASRRADKIRDKLNWQRGILNPTGRKPKGMHWKTYNHLVAKHNNYSDQALTGILSSIKGLKNKLTAKLDHN